MSVTTLRGIIENGQVRLPEEVVLPERQSVYVLVPDAIATSIRSVPGVRLTNPDDAAKFEMKGCWEEGH